MGSFLWFFFSKEEPKRKPWFMQINRKKCIQGGQAPQWKYNLDFEFYNGFPLSVCHQHKASNPFSLSNVAKCSRQQISFSQSPIPAEKNKAIKTHRNKRKRIPILFLHTPTRASVFPCWKRQRSRNVNQRSEGLPSWLFVKVSSFSRFLQKKVKALFNLQSR